MFTISALLSLLCDRIMTSNVNSEVTFCVQFEQNLMFIQRRVLALEELIVCFHASFKGNSEISVSPSFFSPSKAVKYVSETQYLLCNSLKLLSHSLTYTKTSEHNTTSPGARGMTCNQAIEVTIDYN